MLSLFSVRLILSRVVAVVVVTLSEQTLHNQNCCVEAAYHSGAATDEMIMS